MPPIVNAQEISKSFGPVSLFRGISFTVSEGDRIGLIGANGSGKSTLLRILSGHLEPDEGSVVFTRLKRLVYVSQESVFSPGRTIRQVVAGALENARIPESERENRLFETLGRAGFQEFDADASTLSGGWWKRLAIVEALVQGPDVLLLDEPTNHLDLAGIEWLESLIQGAPFACVIVSHDRYFLENVATEISELNPAYPGGLLRHSGNYSTFLEKKEEYLHALSKRQDALENRVRNEIEWLRRGPKARTTKAKARIQKANELIGELADLNARTRTSTAKIDFTETGRQTKRLIEIDQLEYGYDGAPLFQRMDFVISAGTRVGLVGPNGSGKTTLLRLLNGELRASRGHIRVAPSLRVVYFEQKRELDPGVTLRRTLAPEGDSVIYQDRVVHVAAWAARFLFSGEQLNQPVGSLSGGERARVLVARLMLQPADVLLLDEPTNDLDIPTLEVLEESLLEFRGALVLVTHDRYMLDRVSNVVLGLDGRGGAGVFADYSQWNAWQAERNRPPEKTIRAPETRSQNPTARKKLSYLETREYATIEQRIAEAESALEARRSAFEDPAIASDAARLLAAQSEMNEAQDAVDTLYARWAELEERQG